MSDPLDDEIDLLAAALREDERGEEARPGRTLERILAAPAPRSTPATFWLAAAIALLSITLAPSAWAWWTGRFASTEPAAETAAAHDELDTTSHVREATAPRAPSEAPVVAPEAPAAPVVVSPTAAREPTAERASERVGAGVISTALEPVREPTPSPSDALEETAVDSTPVDPAERRAYEAAHALHFEARSPAAAIEAWDAYLTEYPHGRFAPEARYNRALCLVRIGRRAEARVALAPFADGAPGSYRQHEARLLLDALVEPSPGTTPPEAPSSEPTLEVAP